MNRYRQIKGVVEEIYRDGAKHNLDEVRERCRELKIDVDSDKNSVNAAVFKLKRAGYLEFAGEKGTYRLTKKEEAEMKDKKMEDKKTEGQADEKEEDSRRENDLPALDWNHFFVVMPQPRRNQEMKFSVTQDGEIRLNASLQKEIKSRKIEIIMYDNYKMCYLNPQGKNAHEFTKAGIAKNAELARKLACLGQEYPIVYRVAWDDKYRLWRGDLVTLGQG